MGQINDNYKRIRAEFNKEIGNVLPIELLNADYSDARIERNILNLLEAGSHVVTNIVFIGCDGVIECSGCKIRLKCQDESDYHWGLSKDRLKYYDDLVASIIEWEK